MHQSSSIFCFLYMYLNYYNVPIKFLATLWKNLLKTMQDLSILRENLFYYSSSKEHSRKSLEAIKIGYDSLQETKTNWNWNFNWWLHFKIHLRTETVSLFESSSALLTSGENLEGWPECSNTCDYTSILNCYNISPTIFW